MQTYADKPREMRTRAASHSLRQRVQVGAPAVPLADNRAQARAPLQMAGDSSEATQPDRLPPDPDGRPVQQANVQEAEGQPASSAALRSPPAMPPNVAQMAWKKIPNSNKSYWTGRGQPTADDLAELSRQGRVEAPYEHNSIPNAPSASRPHGLFLAQRDSDLRSIGAPFPLNRPAPGEQMPQQQRHEDVSWIHTGDRVQHREARRDEKTIHGGISASEQLQQYGLPKYPRAAWAHIQPDHATPTDDPREDRAMRHPSTEQANQQHTVREYAQSRTANVLGGLVASRHLSGELPFRPGMYSEMHFGTTFLTGEESRTHSDSVPYMTQQSGRYGDETEHAKLLERFGELALASGLRDDGVLDENDVPDQFYISPDDGQIESPEKTDQGKQLAEQIESETDSSSSGSDGDGP